MEPKRNPFVTQIDAEPPAGLRTSSEAEGRRARSVSEEARRAPLDERRRREARPRVLEAYAKSHDRYASLYAKLAR